MNRDELIRLIERVARKGDPWLSLKNNKITELPDEISQLTDVTYLDLQFNELEELPGAIGKLDNLRELYLCNNRLTEIPVDIAKLTSLEILDVSGNRLHRLPQEIAELRNLKYLGLNNNKLSTLPVHLGKLSSSAAISVDGNPLREPPQAVVAEGTLAILEYLRERFDGSEQRWLSKLLIVGEGGAGKTSVLRKLRGEKFNIDEPTTHGIYIQPLNLKHRQIDNVKMTLNCWDFGGQQIYHATHQFFLTNRSLFLLVWNARLGYQLGNLYKWLDTIHALAPESPIILVATHVDERDADLPLADLLSRYPNIQEQCAVSNKDGMGTSKLREKIAEQAAKLPLMGENWPRSWLKAAEHIRGCADRHISPNALWNIMHEHGVAEHSLTVLAKWLHELGDILYFQDSEDLRDVVILKPQWVSQYISKVLEDERVIKDRGVFKHQEMVTLWKDIEPPMREHFLRLMERFDLSYRTLENKEVSLVVERLPLDTPNYENRWNAIQDDDDCKEISMKFKLSTLPAGIPTWFIARSHRFTTRTHWRYGALFAYGPEQKEHLAYTPERTNLALVRATEHDSCLYLIVRGPNPQNFFALLKDGLELTLRRFPGLAIVRTVPCPGHERKPCPHEFQYEHLLRRFEKQIHEVECEVSFEKVSVPDLLFGIHWSTEDAVFVRLDELEREMKKGHREIISELGDLRELTQLEFTNLFRREQAKPESQCPNIFSLRADDPAIWVRGRKLPNIFFDPLSAIEAWTDVLALRTWFDKVASQRLHIQLYCQAPGCWHPTLEGGRYEIKRPAEWLQRVAPYLKKFVNVLKYAAPIVGPWLGTLDEEKYEKLFKDDIEFMKALVEKLPEIDETKTHVLLDGAADTTENDVQQVHGPALRALRALLDEVDERQYWGGLQRVLTPEGHYLWLCEHHARSYQA